MALWERARSEYPVGIALLALASLYLFWSRSLEVPLVDNVFRDPDTLLRLTIVRSMHDGTWQRGFLSRNDAPFGTILHWSSLFAWMLLGATKLLWFLPFDKALVSVALIAGPLAATLCVVTAYFAARPLMPPFLAAVFALTAVTSPGIIAYSRLGTANHHVLLLWITLCLLGAAVRIELHSGGRWPAIIGGICAGLGLWISFETLIFTEMFVAYAAFRWIIEGKRQADNLRLTTLGFCGVALLGLLVDPPYGGYASIEVDRLSLPYVFALSLQLATVMIATAIGFKSPVKRVACFATCALVSLVAQLAIFPVLGMIHQFNPFIVQEWASSIGELSPVRSLWRGFEFLGNGVIGILAAVWMPNRSWSRRFLYAIGLSVLGIGAFSHIRYSPYFLTMGAFAAFCFMASIMASQSKHSPGILGIMAVYCSLYILAGNYLVGTVLKNHPHRFTGYESANCKLPEVLPEINNRNFLKSDARDPIFVVNLDYMPQILFGTNYRTLAGNYHEDTRGLNDIYLMMRDPGWSLAHSIVNDHHINFMMLCPSADRDRFGVTDSELYWKYSTPAKEFRQPTFYTRILDGDLPPWLIQRQWPAGTKTDLKLFQVFDSPSPPGKNS